MRDARGRNGQPTIELDGEHGHVTVYLQGAHVTSWVPAGGAEVLFVSEAARFAPGEAIRGGVPIAFPQFAELGPLPMHGFAHTMPWECTGRSGDALTLTLRDTAATRALWPRRFEAELEVKPGPGMLTLAFTVRNVDRTPLTWAGTLHTFLALDSRQARIRGLGPGRYLDRGQGGRAAEDRGSVLRVPGHTDRAYLDAGSSVEVSDGRRALRIGKAGFRDTVVWNPGPETTPRFADLAAGDHAAFVCIEAAEVRPVTLGPGDVWSGRQELRVLDGRGAGPG